MDQQAESQSILIDFCAGEQARHNVLLKDLADGLGVVHDAIEAITQSKINTYFLFTDDMKETADFISLGSSILYTKEAMRHLDETIADLKNATGE